MQFSIFFSRRPRLGSVGAAIDEIDRLGAWNSTLDTSDTPLMEQSSLRHGTLIPLIASDRVGTCTHPGRRSYQEDRFIVMQLELEGGPTTPTNGNDNGASGVSRTKKLRTGMGGDSSLLLLAVFDGHGGDECAQYCQENLHR